MTGIKLSGENSIINRFKAYREAVRGEKEKERIKLASMTPQERKRYRRIQRSVWLREDREEVELCKGAKIHESVFDIGENRYYTLILKGIIVYLLTAGGIGAYLTALEIDFNQPVFNLIILATAILCATLYHSYKSENLGYLIFFVAYSSILILFKNYINSGFYAIINITQENASIYFGTEGLQYYNERIANRYVSVTIAVSLIGIAENILLNNYILRRARYMIAIALTLTLNVFAFYMEKEPSTIYSLMVISGIVMTYLLKCGRHFYLSRNDHIFSRSAKGLSYRHDYKSLLHTMIIGFIAVLLVVFGVSIVFDKDTYDSRQKDSREKVITREYMQNLMSLGALGLFNFYDSTGGLATGRLGGVSSIQLDYNTDLTVEYTPYSSERLYIKNFTGLEYKPYENVWDMPPVMYLDSEQSFYEADALKQAYQNGEEYGAEGIMKITNVAADYRPYTPYYTGQIGTMLSRGESGTYTYYPRLEGNETEVHHKSISPDYLNVPDANLNAVRSFVEEAGFKGEGLDLVRQVEEYYDQNIPYTIRPGATPWREDFINYFLTKNKKGYCAHFASAATLIFRYLGLPARYCEGYVIDYNQVLDSGEMVEGAKYEDYYKGYSPIGETALVRVDATDADAHAWVEVYLRDYGWVIADVTPAYYGSDDEYSSFWDSFNNLFGDGTEAADRTGTAPNLDVDFTVNEALMRGIALTVLGVIVAGLLLYFLFRMKPVIKYHMDYSRAGTSDKLILSYSWGIKKLARKDPELGKRINYKQQLDYLLKKKKEESMKKGQPIPAVSESSMERAMDILERAGFSNKEITEEESGFVTKLVEELTS